MYNPKTYKIEDVLILFLYKDKAMNKEARMYNQHLYAILSKAFNVNIEDRISLSEHTEDINYFIDLISNLRTPIDGFMEATSTLLKYPIIIDIKRNTNKMRSKLYEIILTLLDLQDSNLKQKSFTLTQLIKYGYNKGEEQDDRIYSQEEIIKRNSDKEILDPELGKDLMKFKVKEIIIKTPLSSDIVKIDLKLESTNAAKFNVDAEIIFDDKFDDNEKYPIPYPRDYEISHTDNDKIRFADRRRYFEHFYRLYRRKKEMVLCLITKPNIYYNRNKFDSG